LCGSWRCAARLDAAGLYGAQFSGARLEGAWSTEDTSWPDEFQWQAAGVMTIEELLASEISADEAPRAVEG
jgi:hypothetical protein